LAPDRTRTAKAKRQTRYGHNAHQHDPLNFRQTIAELPLDYWQRHGDAAEAVKEKKGCEASDCENCALFLW
jgi:hypothetical protein